MDDTFFCPICGNKLRNQKLKNKWLPQINRTSNYIYRMCQHGLNHFLEFYVDTNSKKISYIKFSLDPKNNRMIALDFINKKSLITCNKNSEPFNLKIPKLIEPDFPKLTHLKDKVSSLILFL